MEIIQAHPTPFHKSYPQEMQDSKVVENS